MWTDIWAPLYIQDLCLKKISSLWCQEISTLNELYKYAAFSEKDSSYFLKGLWDTPDAAFWRSVQWKSDI